MKNVTTKKRTSAAILYIALCILLIPIMGIPTAKAAAMNTDNVEYMIFPAATMNITQLAYEGYSHSSQNAIDIYPDGDVFAPFSGTITYIDNDWGYVTLASDNRVIWADGSYDYATVGFMHDSDVTDLSVGMHLKQGEVFYQAGGMGNGNPNAYANHVHLTVHRGNATQDTAYGNGSAYAIDAFFVSGKTTNFQGRGEGYAISGMHNGAPSTYEGRWVGLDYLGECQRYRLDEMWVCTSENVHIKTLPCSQSTRSDSLSIRKAIQGESVRVISLYLNTKGNLWACCIADGRVGYLYIRDVSPRQLNNSDLIEILKQIEQH